MRLLYLSNQRVERVLAFAEETADLPLEEVCSTQGGKGTVMRHERRRRGACLEGSYGDHIEGDQCHSLPGDSREHQAGKKLDTLSFTRGSVYFALTWCGLLLCNSDCLKFAIFLTQPSWNLEELPDCATISGLL